MGMRNIILTTTLVLTCGLAQAQTTAPADTTTGQTDPTPGTEAKIGLYLGAGITRASVHNIFHQNLDIDNTSWKALVGFRPVKPFAIEADYYDFGSQSSNFGGVVGAHARVHAFGAFGVLYVPIPFFDLYGKAGVSRWQLSGSVTRPSLFSLDDSGTEFAYGAGAQAHIGRFGARLEYEHMNIRNTDGARVYSLSAVFLL